MDIYSCCNIFGSDFQWNNIGLGDEDDFMVTKGIGCEEWECNVEGVEHAGHFRGTTSLLLLVDSCIVLCSQ